ncbi:MAG: hypothetical protein HYS78_01990 [Parcubacteria group bacterium]|nr:hypothetical protein [Parcubacteria group bacterium]
MKLAVLIFTALVLVGIGLVFSYLPKSLIEVKNAFLPEPHSSLNANPSNPPRPATLRTVFIPDIEPQKQLSNPPKVVKAVYLTGWSAGSETKIQEVINLAREGKINAAVIDIKDFSGETFLFPRPNALIKRLHDENIYIIARMAVFQDQVLAKARPELTVKSIKLSQLATASDDLWRDFKGLAWIDPASSASWDYNIKIAKDAWNRGFDEINFDYIRFPTDGDLNDRKFPVWDGRRLMSLVMKDFYKKVRQDLPEARLSIDLFGLAATSFYDFGVGQIIEDAFQYFDFVSPMLYPSHFPLSFLGPPMPSSVSEEGEYKKPAEYPYEVVKKSMDTAFARLKQSGSSASLRPWLQDFDLGADYDAEKVKVQIQATIDAFGGESSPYYRGFMLWNPANVYTEEALWPY